MKNAFVAEQTIKRPSDEVWAALTDWKNAHNWMPGIDSLRSEGDLAVGTRLTFRARGKDRPSEIAALDPGRSLTLRSKQGRVTADYTYEVEPAEHEASRVTLTAACEAGGPFSVIAPLLRLAMRRTDSKQLDELKSMVESA